MERAQITNSEGRWILCIASALFEVVNLSAVNKVYGSCAMMAVPALSDLAPQGVNN
jgi:hypothetical protein